MWECGDCDNLIYREDLPFHSQNYCKRTGERVKLTDKECEYFRLERYIVGWVE